jgi:hypothetical protein
MRRLALMFACLSLLGCSGGLEVYGSGGSSGVGSGGAGGGAGGAGGSGGTGSDPKAIFESTVQPILDAACHACHTAGGAGPGFLVPSPDEYSAVKSWPGLLGPTPAQSKLYTKGQHEGPALTPEEATTVAAWINAEAAANQMMPDAGMPAPAIAPFMPTMGANTIDLSPLGPTLTGAQLRFSASMGASGLSLSMLQLVAPTMTGVHAVHPLFTVYPATGDPQPDPADSFQGMDMTVAAGQTQTVGPGFLLLTNYQSGMLISVAFDTFAPATGGGTPSGGCKNVGNFTNDAKAPLQANCTSCHGGANASAVAAVDMTRVGDATAAGQAAACAQVRNRTTPATPAMSDIFIQTAPNSATGHPFRFASTTASNAFQQAVTPWIVSEQ